MRRGHDGLRTVDPADEWVAMWTPFVIAGIGLCFSGALLAHGTEPSNRKR